MTAETLDDERLEEIVGDFEIPCEWSNWASHRGGNAAWMLNVGHGCGRRGWRFVCPDCKDAALAPDSAVECLGCGEVVAPIRKAVRVVLPL